MTIYYELHEPSVNLPTPRQLEILALLASGKTRGEIALLLGISRETLKNQVGRMYRRIGAGSETHALAICVAHGWITLRSDSNFIVEITD